MIRRRLPWLAILLTLPFLGGVQNCNRPAPATSGDPQPTADPGETGPAGEGSAETGETGATGGEGGETGEATATPPAAMSSEKLARRMFDEGLLALSMKPPQVPTAIDRFDQVTQLMPDWPEGFYNLGLAYVEGDNLVKAIPALERATLLDAELGGAWIVLGQSYEKQNRVGAAMDAYSQCVRNIPDNTDCRLGSVRYAYEQGEDLDSIVRQVREILEINSTSVGAYVLLSQAYIRQGDHKLAQFALLKAQQANELAKSDPTVHCNMGMIYRAMGLDYEAEESFNAALKADPNHIQTLVNLANIRVANLDFEGAKELVTRAVIQEEKHIGARLALGIAKRGTGDLDGAKAEFQFVRDNDPGNHDALYNLAVLHGDHYRDFDKAIELYEELIRISPGLPAEDPLHEYLAEAIKSKEREAGRLEREKRKQERDEQKRKQEAEQAAEEARKAAEEAARIAREAVEAAGSGGTTGDGTEGGDGAEGTPDGTPEEGGRAPPRPRRLRKVGLAADPAASHREMIVKRGSRNRRSPWRAKPARWVARWME